MTIPNGVTDIGKYAFDGCIFLTKIIIPDSVTHIGAKAFRDCGSLTSITIPASVTHIDNYVFPGCKNLTTVTIPGEAEIGHFMFHEDLSHSEYDRELTYRIHESKPAYPHHIFITGKLTIAQRKMIKKRLESVTGGRYVVRIHFRGGIRFGKPKQDA